MRVRADRACPWHIVAGHQSEAMLLGVFQVSWLHLFLGVTMVGLSFLHRDTRDRAATRNTTGPAY